MLVHLAVPDGDPRFRDDRGQLFGPFADGLHPVMDEEDLPAAAQLPQDRLADQLLGEAGHEGLDRQPVHRRGIDDGEVADTHHGHVKGARNGGGGQGHDIHHGPERLQSLLVLDAETLLLVDDQKPQILEGHILLQHAVGADDDVDLPFFEPLQDSLLLLGRAEAGEHLHRDRILLEPLVEGLVVLLGQDGGRHQNTGLLAVQSGFKGGPHGDLGLAVTHIAADQPVHRFALLHVGQHILDGRELVRGLLPGKGGLELPVHFIRGRKGKPFAYLAFGIDLQQFSGHFLHRFSGLALGLFPADAAQLVKVEARLPSGPT